MIYMDMPVIIPVLATGYLLTIYLLLIVAQRTIKNSQYAGNSTTKDTYASYLPTEQAPPTEESEQWSFSMSGATSLASNDLPHPVSQPPNVQEASRV